VSAPNDAVERLLRSWRGEVEAAATYELLAARQGDARRADVIRCIAAAERSRRARIEARLRELGAPVLPIFWLPGTTAVVAAAAVSLLAHFLVGAARSLVTLRSWWAAGLEMTLAGVVVGVVTYAAGLLFGA
jgi:hypothetical protein